MDKIKNFESFVLEMETPSRFSDQEGEEQIQKGSFTSPPKIKPNWEKGANDIVLFFSTLTTESNFSSRIGPWLRNMLSDALRSGEKPPLKILEKIMSAGFLKLVDPLSIFALYNSLYELNPDLEYRPGQSRNGIPWRVLSMCYEAAKDSDDPEIQKVAKNIKETLDSARD